MPIERWSDQVSVVHLGDDPQFSDDVSALDSLQFKKGDAVVLDFSAVHFVNSSNLAALLKLRKALAQAEGRLMLCGVSTQVWGTFLATGLDRIFQFSDSVPLALATIQIS